MAIYGIDINPMKPWEFIINGDDEYVRIFDKRHIPSGPAKVFRRPIPVVSINKFKKHVIKLLITHHLIHFQSTDDDDHRNLRSISPSVGESHITSAVYSYCGTEILASYSEDDIYLFDANGSPETYLHRYSGHLNRMTGIYLYLINL